MFEEIDILEILIVIFSLLVGLATFLSLQSRRKDDGHLYQLYLMERKSSLNPNGDQPSMEGEIMVSSGFPSYGEWRKIHEF